MSIEVEEKAIRLKEVMSLVGMSRSWVYARIAKGAFPAPAYRLGASSCWSLREVMSWLESQRTPRTA